MPLHEEGQSFRYVPVTAADCLFDYAVYRSSCSTPVALICAGQAIAQSVRGLRQSAVLCDREELPLTMDLLQGSEAVAAVLRRYSGPNLGTVSRFILPMGC